ncbi:hypothetical protein V6N13_042731 [Hibiscus sabdariffa]
MLKRTVSAIVASTVVQQTGSTFPTRHGSLVERIENGRVADHPFREFMLPNNVLCSHVSRSSIKALMADIALLMAKLQCSEEDLDGMDPIQFEEDHHVEGSDKWLVRKCSLLPEGDVPEFQYGSWLKVETTRPNQDKAKKLRTGIVFTKPVEPAMVRERSALAISTQNGDRGKGEVRAHPIQKARSGYMGVRIVKAYTWAPRRLGQLLLSWLGMYGSLVVERSNDYVGLLLLWSDAINVSFLSFSKSHIDIETQDANSHFLFTGMYGTSDHSRKHEDWALLDNLHSQSNLPWLLGGDLNVILNHDEKDGSRRKPWSEMEAFCDALVRNDLWFWLRNISRMVMFGKPGLVTRHQRSGVDFIGLRRRFGLALFVALVPRAKPRSFNLDGVVIDR